MLDIIHCRCAREQKRFLLHERIHHLRIKNCCFRPLWRGLSISINLHLIIFKCKQEEKFSVLSMLTSRDAKTQKTQKQRRRLVDESSASLTNTSEKCARRETREKLSHSKRVVVRVLPLTHQPGIASFIKFYAGKALLLSAVS